MPCIGFCLIKERNGFRHRRKAAAMDTLCVDHRVDKRCRTPLAERSTVIPPSVILSPIGSLRIASRLRVRLTDYSRFVLEEIIQRPFLALRQEEFSRRRLLT